MSKSGVWTGMHTDLIN